MEERGRITAPFFRGGRLRAPPVADEASNKELQRSAIGKGCQPRRQSRAPQLESGEKGVRNQTARVGFSRLLRLRGL